MDIDRRQIIDGQQRLITTQLLFTASRDVAAQVGLHDIEAQLDELISNSTTLPERDRPKIRPINPDNGAFAKIALRRSEQANPDSQITLCYRYFKQQLEDWLSRESPEFQLRNLLFVLKKFLNIVLIDIEPGDDAQAIFETLNNRGLKLAKSDLIWNYMVREARNPNNQPNNLEEVNFDEGHEAQFLFQNPYWREEEDAGRKKFPRIDIFMAHFLAMKRLTPIKNEDIFDEFKLWYQIEIGSKTFQSILDDMLYYGRIYNDWKESSEKEDEGALLFDLNLLGVTTVHPLLLWLLGLEKNRFSKKSLPSVIKLISSFLFRRIICGYPSAGYNKHFIRILTQLQETDCITDTLHSILLEDKARTTRWPTNLEVIDHLATDRFGSRMIKARTRNILSRIDKQMMQNEGDMESHNYEDMTLEHLLPRSWRPEDWPIDNDNEYSREIRGHTIELIGNLTLLSGPLNSEISNGPWKKKREKILEMSAFALNRKLPETWDEDKIHQRTEELAKIICQIWPRPELGSLPEAAE